MKVLVLGSGGREHAIIWKLKQSKLLNSLYCIPGNGGISKLATIEPSVKLSDFDKILQYILQNKIDFVFVGPEQPSVDGIKDFLIEHNIPTFSPTKKQAQLEGSKVFAKNFMKQSNIPTADFVTVANFTKSKLLIKEMFKKYPEGIVIKADGLAAGKGVVVCNTLDEAEKTVEDMMVRKIFGSSGDKIVIERKLKGVEISAIAFCDGKTILPLTYSQDHKQIYDDDKGPNTGGMGAYSPVPFVSKNLEEKIKNEVFDNFIKGIKEAGIDYCGVIYFGLMIENIGTKNEQPYVLEFNCRFGDPETQVLLPLLKNDLLEIAIKCVDNNLSSVSLKFENKFACCVVLASKGYPGSYETDKEIFGLDSVENLDNIILFHAGTKIKNNKFFTSGGRVLNVVGLAETLKKAITTAYLAVGKINFDNKYNRTDIGKKGLISYDNI